MKRLFAMASLVVIGASSFSSALAAAPESTSSEDLISWGYNNGLTKFDSWSAFNPTAPVTREQAAKMITTWIQGKHELGLSMPAEANCTFQDAASIDSTLSYGVESACTYGLFKGYKGNFMPKNNLLRQDARTLLVRALDQLPAYEAYRNEVPAISAGFITRGELLTALYKINVIAEGKISAQKDEMLSAVWAELKKNEQLWDSKDITHYSVAQQHSCFCTPNSTHPIQFEVKNNAVVTGSLEDMSETDKIAASQLTVTPMTVEEAFAFIQDAIDRKADSITVEYDAKLGNPTKINIDYSTMMADEETYYTYKVIELQ